jgi:hypothetical protein
MVCSEERSCWRASGASSNRYSIDGTISVAVAFSRSTVRHHVARLRSFIVIVQPPRKRIGKKTMPLA